MAKTLEYCMNLNYRAEVVRKNGMYRMFIPELVVCAEDDSIERAYEKLETAKEEYFKRMIEGGYEDYIVEPEMQGRTAKRYRADRFSEFGVFFIKLMITVFLLLILMGVTYKLIEGKGKSKIASSWMPEAIVEPHIFVYHKIKDINAKLKDMPMERREEIRAEISEALNNSKPFLDEFVVFFSQYRNELCGYDGKQTKAVKRHVSTKAIQNKSE